MGKKLSLDRCITALAQQAPRGQEVNAKSTTQHPPTLQHLHLPFPERGRGPLQPRPELVDQTRLDLHAFGLGVCLGMVVCVYSRGLVGERMVGAFRWSMKWSVDSLDQ